MFEQRHQTVSTAKFVEAMRTAGINIANKWSGLTIEVGLNATAVTWRETQPPAALVEPVAETIPEKPPSKKRTKPKTEQEKTSEDLAQ